MYSDDHYNFNYAQAKAATGNYKEAEEVSYGVTSVLLRLYPSDAERFWGFIA